MSFRKVTSILWSVWRRPKQPLVQVPHNSVKLYERTPPAWARWALVLVAVDVMVSTSAVELIWNGWTMPDPDLQHPPREGKAAAAAAAATTTTEPHAHKKENWLSMLQIIPPGHVLVPAWKRALAGSVFVLSGMVIAASILAARSRVVRSVSYVRTALPPASIVVQTAGHPRTMGHAHAVRDCWLAPSSRDQLMLEVRDQGRWVVDMRPGARIAGRLAPEDRTLTRSAMLKTWKSVEGSTRSFP